MYVTTYIQYTGTITVMKVNMDVREISIKISDQLQQNQKCFVQTNSFNVICKTNGQKNSNRKCNSPAHEASKSAP